MLAWIFLLGVSANAFGLPQPAMLKDDPIYAARPVSSEPVYKVNMRWIVHDVSPQKEWLDRMVRVTEIIYSSCEGFDVKVQVIGTVKAKKSNLQDDLTGANDKGRMFVGDSFNDFFEPWAATRSFQVVDVHLVDHMAESTRQEVKQGKSPSLVYLGKSFSQVTTAFLYEDMRSSAKRKFSVPVVSGNSVLLSADTAKAYENRKSYFPLDRADGTVDRMGLLMKERSSSLLAHEIGHIVFEYFTTPGRYIDHYCPGAREVCPRDNVMSSGGSKDIIYFKPPKNKEIMGYSALPVLEREQCDLLKNHSLVVK